MWGASGQWKVKRGRVDVGGDFCVYLWELCGSGVTDETKESKPVHNVATLGSLSLATLNSCQSAVPPSNTHVLRDTSPFAKSAERAPEVTGPTCSPLALYHQFGTSFAALSLRVSRGGGASSSSSSSGGGGGGGGGGVGAEAAGASASSHSFQRGGATAVTLGRPGGKQSARCVMSSANTCAAEGISTASSPPNPPLFKPPSDLHIVGAKTRAKLDGPIKVSSCLLATASNSSTSAFRVKRFG